MCVHMHACVCSCAHVHVCACAYACACVFACECVRASPCVCAFACLCASACAYVVYIVIVIVDASGVHCIIKHTSSLSVSLLISQEIVNCFLYLKTSGIFYSEHHGVIARRE